MEWKLRFAENINYGICAPKENTPPFSSLFFKTDFLALHKEHELRIQKLEDLLRKLSAESKVLTVSFADLF